MRIKILKDTPFDRAETVLSMNEFRLKYGYLCTEQVTNKELFDHIKYWNDNPIEIVNTINEWFEAVELNF